MPEPGKSCTGWVALSNGNDFTSLVCHWLCQCLRFPGAIQDFRWGSDLSRRACSVVVLSRIVKERSVCGTSAEAETGHWRSEMAREAIGSRIGYQAAQAGLFWKSPACLWVLGSTGVSRQQTFHPHLALPVSSFQPQRKVAGVLDRRATPAGHTWNFPKADLNVTQWRGDSERL